MGSVATSFDNFQPRHSYLVAIDSDGCAFDTMELKHKECFIPNTINEWDLQVVAKYARQVAEFVNLYSKWRGINRFPALVLTFDLLKERPEVQRRGAKIPEVPHLREWIQREIQLANPTLERACRETGFPDLQQALRWSRAVNESVTRMVRGVPPFPFVRESLQRLARHADLVVVSATPTEALVREWEEHGLVEYVSVIAGQEVATKKQMLRWVSQRYPEGRVLMIGDAPGDQEAARQNGVLFYPITPGQEEDAWERFHREALERFLEGSYSRQYEQELVAVFEQSLPETPPWKR
jgi:phosphoglycolate phosphatase-like HAD superfamily hydrolase